MNERMKPIEAGCNALILRSPNHPEWEWLTVEVIRRGSAEEQKDFNDFWLVDIPEDPANCFVREPCLLRIDDPDLQKQIEREQEREGEAA